MADIKKLAKKDFLAFAEIATGAFPGMGMNTEEKIQELADWAVKKSESKYSTFYGLYKNKKIIGALILYDFEMNLFGNRVLCGGGGFLVVDLLHKKEHVAKDLCKFFFEHYRKRHAIFASLYPFRPDFYRMMGAGYGNKVSVYRINPKDFPTHGSKKYLKKLSKKDSDRIIECFNAYADRKTGMFYDSSEHRENFFRHNKESRFFGYEKDGKLLGYLVFKFVKTNPHNPSDFLHNEIHITEMIYLNNDVLAAFMTFLHTQKDQVEVIKYISHDENFHFALHDPRNDSGTVHSPVYHEINQSSVGIMYRLLNPKLLFTTLKNHSFGDITLRIKLEINDSFLKVNDKPIVIYFENGLPTVKSITAKTDVTMTLHTSDFTSLVLGAVDFKSLHMYGLVKCSNEKYNEDLNRLFYRNEKPVCLTQF